MNNYPTDKQLEVIKNFDLIKHPVKEFLDYVQPLWEYPDRFCRTKHRLYLSTGGWSGNESIISAMQQNYLFWGLYWQKSQRGGHYWFDDEMVSGKGGFK